MTKLLKFVTLPAFAVHCLSPLAGVWQCRIIVITALGMGLAAQPGAARGPAKAGALPSMPKSEAAKVTRRPAEKRAFEKANPCPSTAETGGACPGYVVDHVVPLKRGGADSPSNMQWQTTEQAKAKDRVE
jgi:hypothetical protein